MTAAWIGAAAAVLGVLIGAKPARMLWHLVRGTTRFLDDYFGEPPRDGYPGRPGVMARLASMDDRLGRVEEQLSANGHGSIRDAVDRVEDALESSLGTVCLNFKPAKAPKGEAHEDR
jgi:hypothetical protein